MKKLTCARCGKKAYFPDSERTQTPSQKSRAKPGIYDYADGKGERVSKLLNRKSLGGSYDFRLDDGFCVANCGIGKGWCTVYLIETHPEHRGKGEAQKLLRVLQEKCKQTNRRFRVWYPMNDVIEYICKKLNVEVIRDIDREEVAGQD